MSTKAIYLLTLLMCIGCSAPIQEVSLIIQDAQIYTPEGIIEGSVAIDEGKILEINSDQVVGNKYRGSEEIPLDGRLLLPGLIDGHVHPLMGGTILIRCNLTDLRDEASILAKIKEYAQENQHKDWIIGGGLWLPAVGGGTPTREQLDEIVPDKPAFIQSADGHSVWVNSKALALAGIDRNTKNPPSGVIEKDPVSGEPIGTLREHAIDIVRKYIPPLTAEQRRQALMKAIELGYENGITQFVDASIQEDQIIDYIQLKEEGLLDMPIVLSIKANLIKGLDAVDEVVELYEKYKDRLDPIRLNSVKIFIDGVIEGKTAALLENYEKLAFKGEPVMEPAIYNKLINTFDSLGFQIHVHACGDKAVRMTLDAFEEIQMERSKLNHRHHIVHMQLIDEADINRFEKIGVIANFQPLWATPEDTYISELTIPVLGEERSEWIYPLGAVAKSGAKIAHGSDWPVTTINPFHAIQVAVTRRGPDLEKREPWTSQHLVDLKTVLDGYTQGGAYLMNTDESTGVIEVGKDANLVILNQNVLEIEKEKIHLTQVDMTFIKGKRVY